ncbi:MAG: mannose-1-phosphate guanylyltransferase [Deltaproteobacteria bacterium]|nr:mannose-1-phosphate guanylyltransferase [Deltaproteobacteria bacterium]
MSQGPRSTQAPANLVVVIMAGGAGTRFWPLSTEKRPKQFLTLLGERTLLQQSYDRARGLVPPERILVLTNDRFVPLVREQLPELPERNTIGEPCRRDTAAAVALAALLAQQRFGAAVMAVLTADHLIQPVEALQETIRSAARAAASSDTALYTFGITPAYPATGYGYLHRGKLLEQDGPVGHYELEQFREKPDLATAEAYVASGEYSWNSGMFVWSTTAILAELARHVPDHLTHLRPVATADGTPGFADALRAGFEPLRSISIDFAVMEKAADVRCAVARFDWSDVGGWLALEEFLEKDASENAHRGAIHTEEAGRNLVFCEDPTEHVALVGVRDLVVVRTGDRTLIVHRDQTELVKTLVKKLDENLR